MSKSKNIALGVLIGSIGTVGIAALGGIAYVYSGGYNVAATEPHAPTMRWALDTSYQNAVQTRSDTTARSDRKVAAPRGAAIASYT